jgi:hypothetical protein
MTSSASSIVAPQYVTWFDAIGQTLVHALAEIVAKRDKVQSTNLRLRSFSLMETRP